jgi:3-oxoacyl-[acyl-carrier protein] reductase
MTSSDTRVALVTGAGGGLGHACVVALVDAGFHVVATDLNADALASLSGGEIPESALTLRDVDVTDSDAVDEVVRGVVDVLGRIDVLVNLAGVARNQMLHKVSDAEFNLVLATHLSGTMHTMRAVAPVMKTAHYGRIVNMSSIAVRGSIAGSAYAAAKGAIEGLTRAAAMELAPHDITVNCVAPGMVDVGIFLTTPQEYQDEVLARVPAGRAARVEEIADVVAFFASEGASYVTGQSLFVCGGASLGF